MDFVVFLDVDWQTTEQRNRQHFLINELACQLEGRSKILGVERPICPWTGLLRTRQKLIQWIQGKRGLYQARANLYIYTPFVFIHNLIAARLPWITALNRCLLRVLLRRVLKRLDFKTDNLIAWIHHPYQLEDIRLLDEKSLVYDCYDEYLAPTNYRSVAELEMMREREQRILERADLVFAASEQVAARKRLFNERTYYLPNAADYEHFSLARDERTRIPCDVSTIRHPIIGFVGTINESIDFGLLTYIARSKPEWSIVLIGPFYSYRTGFLNSHELREAKACPNIYFLGAKPYEDIPRYLKAFDVCMIPYKETEFNLNRSPVKLYEYMASGKPVVSIGCAQAKSFGHVIATVENSDAFVEAIENVLNRDYSSIREQEQEIASWNSWKARATEVLRIIQVELGQ